MRAHEDPDVGLLCHCAGRDRGHEPGAPACHERPLKRGRYVRLTLDQLADAALSPVVLAAVRELRKVARCQDKREDGTPCPNRALSIGGRCGVHR